MVFPLVGILGVGTLSWWSGLFRRGWTFLLCLKKQWVSTLADTLTSLESKQICGCSSSNPGLLMKFIWEIQAWISFSKPPAILECSQSGGPLLPMSEGRDEPCTVHPGVHGCDWVPLPPPPAPGLIARETRMYVPCSQSTTVSQHTGMHKLTQTCRSHRSAFYHPLVISYFNWDCLHFQNFDGAKSQLITKGKQSRCLKELSGCHRRRRMKSKHLRALACFHGK